MVLYAFVFHAQKDRQIDQNDIQPNQTDVFPADFDALFTTEEPKKTRSSRQHQPKDPAVIGVHFHVADPSEIFAVPHVDDIFCLKLAEPEAFVHKKSPFPAAKVRNRRFIVCTYHGLLAFSEAIRYTILYIQQPAGL